MTPAPTKIRQGCRLRDQLTALLGGGSRRADCIEHCGAIGEQCADPIADDLLYLCSRDPIGTRSLARPSVTNGREM